MASLNKTFIIGRLGQDPELRYTPNQTAVVTLNVATSETWNRDGQKHEQTEWHRIVVWSRQAENCAKYLSKGSSVFVEGKLQTRNWEDKNGQKKYTTEIIASSVQFMSSANQGQGGNSSQEQDKGPINSHSFPPADQNKASSSANDNDLDDIPF
jgi:single-strand DNA-binding protein